MVMFRSSCGVKALTHVLGVREKKMVCLAVHLILPYLKITLKTERVFLTGKMPLMP